jgi:CRP-like cAMP-binding protein
MPVKKTICTHDQLKDVLSKISHFKDLNEETQNEILASANPCHFHAGQVIYLEGEPAVNVYILARGWVKATRITREGREQGLLFLRPVEIFGDIAVFANTTYPGTTTALEDVDAWSIPSEKILYLVNHHPDFALAVIRRLSERVLHYVDLVEDLSLKSVESRLATSLLRNAELSNGQLLVPRQEWTTIDEMAIRLGTVRDVLSRAMKVMEAEGHIQVEKQTIIILNPEGLAKRSNC